MTSRIVIGFLKTVKRAAASGGVVNKSVVITTDASWCKEFECWRLAGVFSKGNNTPNLGRLVREIGSESLVDEGARKDSENYSGIRQPNGSYEAEGLGVYSQLLYYKEKLHESSDEKLTLICDNKGVVDDVKLCLNGYKPSQGIGKSNKSVIYAIKNVIKNVLVPLGLDVVVKHGDADEIAVAHVVSKSRIEMDECVFSQDQLAVMVEMDRAVCVKNNKNVIASLGSIKDEVMFDVSFLESPGAEDAQDTKDETLFAFGSFTEHYKNYVQKVTNRTVTVPPGTYTTYKTVELLIRKAAEPLEVDHQIDSSTVSATADSVMESGIISDTDMSVSEYAGKVYHVGPLSAGQIESFKKVYPDGKHALWKVGLTASEKTEDVKDSDSGSSLFSEAGGKSVKE